MEADDHCVDGSSCCPTTTRRGPSLDNTFAAAHHHPLAGLDQQRCRVRRCQHVTLGRDADRGERSLLHLHPRGRVVGDEQHTVPGGAQIAIASTEPESADGPTRPPRRDHTARHRVHVNRFRSIGSSRWCHIWPCWHARCQPVRVPRFEPFAALRYSVDARRRPSTMCRRHRTTCCRRPTSSVAGPPRAQHRRIDVPLDRDGPTATSWPRDGWRRGSTRRAGSRRVAVVDAVPHGVHRREWPTPSTVGVIGALEVVDEGADGVLPHERTTPKAKTDRLDLTRATRCNLSPVWGLSLTAGLSDLLHEPGETVGRCTDENGVVHASSGSWTRPDSRRSRSSRVQPGADRRRAPSLRDQPHVSRRGARGHRTARYRRRVDDDVRRRTRRRATQHRRDPSGVPRHLRRCPADRLAAFCRPPRPGP